jgi:TM2 domain-containing membrane protein YozV
MSTLNLSDPAPLSAYQPTPPEKLKNAALSFVLSLVLPGSGQMYAGRTTAGAVTLAFFGAGVALSLSLLSQPGNPIGATGVGLAIALYIFAFLDAYFSALEYNAGISSFMIGGNPRIAGILNFLTNGIGYFYLGERAKGLIMFVGLGIFVRQVLQHYFPHSVIATLTWIALQSVLAFDAYRLARRQLLASFPELKGHSWKAGSTGQLPPILPVAVALLLCLSLAGLVLLGTFAQSSKGIQGGEIVTTPEGAQYVNKKLGMKVPLPVSWTADTTNAELNLRNSQGDCKVLLMRDFTLVPTDRYQRIVEKEISKREGFSVHDHALSTLDGRPAVRMTVSIGPTVTENMTTARTGLSVYSLVTIARYGSEGCPRDLAQIERGLHFAR